MSVCVCLCGVGVGFTVSVWGFQVCGLVMFGAPGTALPGTALPGTALPLDRPKFRSFFPSRRKIRSFLPSMGVFSLNFGGVFEDRDPQMCTFGILGLSCASPGGPVWCAGEAYDSGRGADYRGGKGLGQRTGG